jgi:hypothetical protein
MVFYHTVIISGDEANPVTTHVLINVVDGSVIKTKRKNAARKTVARRAGDRSKAGMVLAGANSSD